MARRVVLALGYVGGVLFFLAGIWALLGLEFVCLGGCVPADAPNKVIGLMPHFVPYLVPGAVMMATAWIVCFVLLRRAQWRGWSLTVFAVPMIIFSGSGTALIATWDIFAQTSANYRTVAEGSYPVFFFTVTASILLALVSNLIVIVAGHALRRATPRAALARGRAVAGGRDRSASD